MLKRLFRNRKGAALVEYALLIGGIALIAAGAVSLFGHKTSDIIGTVASILPGAHFDENHPIIAGKLIETTLSAGASGSEGLNLDFSTIAAISGTDRLGQNVGGSSAGGNGLDGLVIEAK